MLNFLISFNQTLLKMPLIRCLHLQIKCLIMIRGSRAFPIEIQIKCSSLVDELLYPFYCDMGRLLWLSGVCMILWGCERINRIIEEFERSKEDMCDSLADFTSLWTSLTFYFG